MEQATLNETFGKLLLSDLFTSIWFGNWDEYESIISRLPVELVRNLPFHKHYDREETALWRDNHFLIPGPYFIPPYLSSYFGKTEEEQDEARQDVLCLIGEFDKLGFYYPLEQNEFPDHFGSVTAFITAALKEEVEASQSGDAELVEQLRTVQHEVYNTYLAKGIHKMLETCMSRLTDPFFKTFIPFYARGMEDIIT